MRNQYNEQLKTLNEELINMGGLCQEAIALSVNALTNADKSSAKQVGVIEEKINDAQRSIETLCLKLLLKQQPVAGDLRQISAALKMITDLERIGDGASDIADITAFLNGKTGNECTDIRPMAKYAAVMVTQSIEAYVNRDLALARKVMKDDDIVDNCFLNVKNTLIKFISENSSDGEYAIDLLMIAKYFERIADHAVNIAEWAEFAVTGIHCGKEEL